MPRSKGKGIEGEEVALGHEDNSSYNGPTSASSATTAADGKKTSHILHRERVSSSANSRKQVSDSLHARSLGFGLRRAILIGRRGGPGTPAPSWKLSDNSILDSPQDHSHQNSRHWNHIQHGQGLTVSARKLAASVWELQESRFFQSGPTCVQEKIQQKFDGLQQDTGQQSILEDQHPLPTLSHISKGSQRKPLTRMKSGDRGRVHSKMEKCVEHQDLHDYKREITIDGMQTCTSGSLVISRKGILTDLTYGPTTTGDLLKLLNYVWSLEEQHTSSMSLVDKLRLELDEARSELQGLLLNEKNFSKEVENISTRITEERALWQEQQGQCITVAVQSVMKELEVERKSKQGLEVLHNKVAKEFRLAKKGLVRALEDLERERKARRLMEEVCDELALEIGQDKARVEELKLESVKVMEEVEEERKMLQMAEIWREERVQMKLMEAKLELEEKNSALNKLRSQLEAFLKEKRAGDTLAGDTILDSGRHPTNVVIGSNLSDSFCSREQQGTPSVSYTGDSGWDQQVKKSAWLTDSEDDDDLHSIELDHEPLVRPESSSSRRRSFQYRAREIWKSGLSDESLSDGEDYESRVGRSQGIEAHHIGGDDQQMDESGREEAEA